LNQQRHLQIQRICSFQKLSRGIRVQIMADRMVITSAMPYLDNVLACGCSSLTCEKSRVADS